MLFGVLGPPLGSVGVLVWSAVRVFAQQPDVEKAWLLLVAPVVGLLFAPLSYASGALPAVVTGAITGLLPRPSALPFVAGAALIGAATSALLGQLGPEPLTAPLIMRAGCGAWAGGVCALLVRRLAPRWRKAPLLSERGL